LVIFGIIIGGRLAIERTGQGDYFTATLAGLVCVAAVAPSLGHCTTEHERAGLQAAI
jgi:hypothetical protein